MPTYEYECDACHHKFEELQSIAEKPLKKCPKCKKQKLRRLFGIGAGFIFKGSGFYQTDYRSESYKAAAKADADNAKPATDKSDSTAKTDTAAKPSGGETGKSKAKSPKSDK
jgi:putative FmdB family regulatory protein